MTEHDLIRLAPNRWELGGSLAARTGLLCLTDDVKCVVHIERPSGERFVRHLYGALAEAAVGIRPGTPVALAGHLYRHEPPCGHDESTTELRYRVSEINAVAPQLAIVNGMRFAGELIEPGEVTRTRTGHARCAVRLRRDGSTFLFYAYDRRAHRAAALKAGDWVILDVRFYALPRDPDHLGRRWTPRLDVRDIQTAPEVSAQPKLKRRLAAGTPTTRTSRLWCLLRRIWRRRSQRSRAGTRGR